MIKNILLTPLWILAAITVGLVIAVDWVIHKAYD